MARSNPSLVNIKQTNKKKCPKPWGHEQIAAIISLPLSFQDTVIFTQMHFPYVYVHFWEYSVLGDPDEKPDKLFEEW